MGNLAFYLSLHVMYVSLACGSFSDDLVFLDPPHTLVSKYPLHVRYRCSQPSVVHLQVLVTYDGGTTVVVFHKHWRCQPECARTRVVAVSFPDWLVYQPDWVVPASDWVLSCLLRAWIGFGESSGPAQLSGARVMVPLDVAPPLSRAFKQHQLSVNWGTELLWKAKRDMPQCNLEHEVVSLLSTIYASTGEHFGIVKTLHPFKNHILEDQRLKSIQYTWCALSLWVLLVKPCNNSFCGLFHHIDEENNYASPIIFLTNSGKIHVQVHGDAGRSSAFLSSFKLPLLQWCQISLEILGRRAKISLACVGGQKFLHSTEHIFGMNVILDDTQGYFVIGGGKFILGIEGYFGPIIYYRTQGLPEDQFAQAEIDLPPILSKVNLTGWFQSCQKFKSELFSSRSITRKRLIDSCLDLYSELLLDHSRVRSPEWGLFKSSMNPFQLQVTELAKQLSEKYGRINAEMLGRKLYDLVFRKIQSGLSLELLSRMMHFVHQSGCLGDQRAQYLSSVLYSSGFLGERDMHKAWLFSLLGAQSDWRFALMRLGHMHHVGDQIVPSDPDLSYAYYSNIARQTSLDQKNVTGQQTFVELIHLNDEERLKVQTSEEDDLFHWIKLQARSGVAEAEQAMGRMLFWGQQGVSPDVKTAVKHYERGAIKLNDPVSMYDYAIVLLTGQGVPKDVPRAVTFLKKAVELGSVPALTALGWYYEQYQNDLEKAVHLWEEADAKGHADAAMNLGVFHSHGLYPGQPADLFKGYSYYLKSAQRGNLNGGIELADLWIHGIPGRVPRRPGDAVLWVKWASEQNGHLGTVLRKGLNAYFRGDWILSLVYYLSAAESGFEAAQFNVAFLCELNANSLGPELAAQCMSRYYNMSIQAQDPAPYALVRMGDVFNGRKEFSSAAEMYKHAALRNEPQGWFNLGLLVQNGASLPFSVLSELDLLYLHLTDREKLLYTLYQRCIETNSTDGYLPCTLALFNAHLQSLHLHEQTAIKLIATVSAVIGTLSFIFGIFKWKRATPINQTSASHIIQEEEEDIS
ncbi:hypothetical protein DNTS_001126 [Danionella cerebrum]|uniref:Uncharacterized protein n=1 Tax=Danionella cerebrum TaxID=2873325 RepID=A0A553P5L3_9TELE|nr:hypothetical protein DNTS_001126 [Danionella translucida]